MPPKPLHVGGPNIGNRGSLYRRLDDILDRRWLSNDGKYVKEFEQAICDKLNVRNCIATCNATIALEIAIQGMDLKGDVILPSYTFVACAHALQWRNITPVFCDIQRHDHLLDPSKVEALITPRTSAILGVHLWGKGCNVSALSEIAERRKIQLFFDASHAFGCSLNQTMIGGFGRAEVFSFHATKFINSFEGGAITTNDNELAGRLRAIRNFGFTGYDRVDYLGTNGKMSEVSAAMGLTNLEHIEQIIEKNKLNYLLYRELLADTEGLSLIDYPSAEKMNFQYIVLEISPLPGKATRDQIVDHLHSNNVIARKYFWPGVHKMEPYKSLYPSIDSRLPETNYVSEKVIVLPTGQSTTELDIRFICDKIKDWYFRALN